MGRKRRNNVYRHYMLQEESQTSTCLLCYKTLNSIHGSNLMNHLKFMHKLEYQQILALNTGAIPPIAPPPINSNDDDDDSNQSESGLEVDVDKFFNIERGKSRARCDICQASVEMKRSSLMKHLKREHPKMLKPANEESEEDEQDENLYQEVVYLYDSDSKSSKNFRPHKLETSTPISSQYKQMKRVRQSNRQSIGVEDRKRRRTLESVASPPVDEFTEELENFGKYVTCLMKTVPKDLCTQLQMDIINLIMTAKIKNMSMPTSSMSQMIEKLDTVTAGPYNQSASVDVNKTDSAPPSPESNVGEIPKIECN